MSGRNNWLGIGVAVVWIIAAAVAIAAGAASFNDVAGCENAITTIRLDIWLIVFGSVAVVNGFALAFQSSRYRGEFGAWVLAILTVFLAFPWVTIGVIMASSFATADMCANFPEIMLYVSVGFTYLLVLLIVLAAGYIGSGRGLMFTGSKMALSQKGQTALRASRASVRYQQ